MEEQQTPEQNQAQCEEYLAGWKRAQADYANLKRETEKEKMEFTKYANENLLLNLLPAIDQYETALSFTPDVTAIPEEEQIKIKNWVIGLHAVRALWETAFQTIGLEKVAVDGQFDPVIHEAIGHEQNDTVQKDGIIKVVQDGWKLNGKLLRPAKVIINSESS